MDSCTQLITTFLLLSLALGVAWAGDTPDSTEPPDELPQPSNIESWNEEEDPTQTWFGMGFETRRSTSPTTVRKGTDKLVNNW
jgi:hypothetical protein